VYLKPHRGSFEILQRWYRWKTRVMPYKVVKRVWRYNAFVYIQYYNVTDCQTDGHTDRFTKTISGSACIACWREIKRKLCVIYHTSYWLTDLKSFSCCIKWDLNLCSTLSTVKIWKQKKTEILIRSYIMTTISPGPFRRTDIITCISAEVTRTSSAVGLGDVAYYMASIVKRG